MNIVIVAGGLGTRFNELSCFPKILLPTINKDSLLIEQMQYFTDAESISIVINAKFYDMVKNYIEVNNIDINIIKSTNFKGSYNSLVSVKDQLPKKDTLFLWSDIMFKTPINLIEYIKCHTSTKNPIIFTTDHNSIYRYNFSGTKIEPRNITQNGNVPGSYYITDVESFLGDYHEGINYDVIDRLNDFYTGIIDKVEFPELLEFKGLEEYKKIIRTCKPQYSKTRFFNSIGLNSKGILVKKLEDKKYKNVISNEISWYTLLKDRVKEFNPAPKIYNMEEESFEMEFLKDYVSLYNYINENKPDINTIDYIYKNIYTSMDIIHQSYVEEKSLDDYMKDLYKEVVQKIIDRCDAIPNLIINYNKGEMVKLLVKAYSILLENTKINENGTVNYYFCHGDVHNSNIMINPKTLDIKFIDPRNYFGFTKGTGNLDYEFSKLLYSIRGFDYINNNKLIYKIDKMRPEYYDNVIEYLDNINYELWIAITFVGLAGYTSGDIMRANIAYEYGIELLKKYIDKYEHK